MIDKFPADVIFEDTEYLYCESFEQGYQIFKSWAEFLMLYIAHMKATEKPMFVYFATVANNNIFVNTGEIVLIPWEELDAYV